jgi:glucoselysine-6-phosphate deglycase
VPRIEDYIRETPDRLQQIRENSSTVFGAIAENGFQRIIMSGSGTSFHSALQMEQCMRECSGLEVRAVYPFAVTKELIGDGTKTLFVGISQGGGSLSTYDAMRLAKDAGCKIATMCGEEATFLDQIADYPLTVNVGEELAGAKTKGYYGTKLNLLLLSQHLGVTGGTLSESDTQAATAELSETLGYFPTVYERSLKWVRAHAEEFAQATDIKVVGSPSLYGDALEVALKMLETLRVPVVGYEFDEFIHGIYNAVNDNSFIIILDDGTEPRVTRMTEVLSNWTEHVYVIGTRQADTQGLSIGPVPSTRYQTFLFPIVGQLLSALVPWAKGYDPGTPKDPEFHQKLASKKN